MDYLKRYRSRTFRKDGTPAIGVVVKIFNDTEAEPVSVVGTNAIGVWEFSIPWGETRRTYWAFNPHTYHAQRFEL